ncbi:MAG: NosR/NirI family protein [Motiliproteus sp.]|nr:NosR/NirI family protein [Motiliproteus sp.]MCW9052924.1 NosR/NirI family protein [Motiliproteus sp.]
MRYPVLFSSARYLVLCWLMLISLSAHSAPPYENLIKELFPEATRIGDQLQDFPVVPVYQVTNLIGYAYQSQELVNLPGFSGKPIKLLIGLDIKGRFSGVKVLAHHEPVFLHGLGQKPLFDFVDQYAGRSLTSQIIIDSSRVAEVTENGPVYIDGVSKATVSVIIINDTILSSALQVARNKLEGFEQQPAAIPKQDLFEPLDWQQLLQQGYVKHWQLSREPVERSLGQSLDNYLELYIEDEDDPRFSDIYYAYLNAPIIGRNLLGEEGFQRLIKGLKPGEQAFAVLSEGLYPHVPSNFKPGTVPNRIALEQNKLAIELRDLNALGEEIGFQAAGIPDFEHAHLFRVKGLAGFNPGIESSLKLNVELKRNHLIRDQAEFTSNYLLPERLFDIVEIKEEVKDPLWLRLWKDRAWQVAVVVLSLVLLVYVFVRQHHFSRHPWFHHFRWAYLIYTLFFLGFYAQGQLSVVNIYTLFLSIYDGFDINIFLLDPVIFILWSFTFVSLFLWGRGLFCGWLCPFGALQEMLSWLAKKLELKQWKVPEPWHRRLILAKYPILVILVAMSFISLTLAEQLAEIEPFKTSITLVFIREWPFVIYAVLLLALGMFIHKFYCRYLCPLGAGLAVLGRLRIFSWLTRIDKCGSPCQLCKRRCEINAIHQDGRIDYDECIQCLECIVILNDQTQCVDALQKRKKQRQPQTPEAQSTAQSIDVVQLHPGTTG